LHIFSPLRAYDHTTDYFDRIKNGAEGDKVKTKLRQDELLYDEAFSIVKVVLPIDAGARDLPPLCKGVSGRCCKVSPMIYTRCSRNLIFAHSHTVEEVQGFANTRTPSPPWVHVVRLLVPMSCCDDAAGYLIKALGGEQVAKRVVGGVKWWQVRGVEG
jgi:hypothetical protein